MHRVGYIHWPVDLVDSTWTKDRHTTLSACRSHFRQSYCYMVAEEMRSYKSHQSEERRNHRQTRVQVRQTCSRSASPREETHEAQNKAGYRSQLRVSSICSTVRSIRRNATYSSARRHVVGYRNCKPYYVASTGCVQSYPESQPDLRRSDRCDSRF